MSKDGMSGTKRSCVELQEDDLGRLEGLSEEEQQTEQKRAYNRKIAARARQRTKDMVDGLTEQVAMHTARNLKLEKAKDELAMRLQALEEENIELRQCIMDPNSVSRERLERLGLTSRLVSSVSSSDENKSSNGMLSSYASHGVEGTDRLYQQGSEVADGGLYRSHADIRPQNLSQNAGCTNHMTSLQQQQYASQRVNGGSEALNGQPNGGAAGFMAPTSIYPSQSLAAIGLDPNNLTRLTQMTQQLQQQPPQQQQGWTITEAERQTMLLAHLLRSHQQQVQPVVNGSHVGSYHSSDPGGCSSD